VLGEMKQGQIAAFASLPRDDDVAEGVVYGGLEAQKGHVI